MHQDLDLFKINYRERKLTFKAMLESVSTDLTFMGSVLDPQFEKGRQENLAKILDLLLIQQFRLYQEQ